MYHLDTGANCPAIPVTEITRSEIPERDDFNGCLVITVTEKGSKLWSITLTGGEDLDQGGREAVFYQLAMKYNWLETKKEKMEFLIEMENIILPKLSIEAMHRKSLIRKLRNALVLESRSIPRGRRAKYNDLDKYHLVQIWKLSGYPCSKRLKAVLLEWLHDYDCSEDIKARLRTISASQMDEYLKQPRIDYQRKVNSGTVPAKNHIKKLVKKKISTIKSLISENVKVKNYFCK